MDHDFQKLLFELYGWEWEKNKHMDNMIDDQNESKAVGRSNKG